MRAWGSNEAGQLTNVSAVSTTIPRKVANSQARFATGEDFSLWGGSWWYLDEEGTLTYRPDTIAFKGLTLYGVGGTDFRAYYSTAPPFPRYIYGYTTIALGVDDTVLINPMEDRMLDFAAGQHNRCWSCRSWRSVRLGLKHLWSNGGRFFSSRFG